MKVIIVLLVICISQLTLNFFYFHSESDDNLIFSLSSFLVLLIVIWLFVIRKNQSFGAGITQLLILIFVITCRIFTKDGREFFPVILFGSVVSVLLDLIIGEFRKSDA